MGSIEPTAEQLQAFFGIEDDGGPLVMINLLRYRERSDGEHPGVLTHPGERLVGLAAGKSGHTLVRQARQEQKGLGVVPGPVRLHPLPGGYRRLQPM